MKSSNFELINKIIDNYFNNPREDNNNLNIKAKWGYRKTTFITNFAK